MTSSSPQKKWEVHLKPVLGSPRRPKKWGCQGVSLVMQGTPCNSHWSATGLVVAGVLPATIKSTLSPRFKFEATSAARLGLDWLSLTRISTRIGLAPDLDPVLKDLLRLVEDERVRRGKKGNCSRLRTDEADLEAGRRHEPPARPVQFPPLLPNLPPVSGNVYARWSAPNVSTISGINDFHRWSPIPVLSSCSVFHPALIILRG